VTILRPNKRLQLTGAASPGLRPVRSAGGGQRTHRIRKARARRPQLNREALGSSRVYGRAQPNFSLETSQWTNRQAFSQRAASWLPWASPS